MMKVSDKDTRPIGANGQVANLLLGISVAILNGDLAAKAQRAEVWHMRRHDDRADEIKVRTMVYP